MAYYPASTTVAHYHDENGDLLNGGTLKAFLAGGSTPTPFYLDEAGTSLGTSVTLNARGEPEYNGDTVILYLNTTLNYKIELYDADSNLIWTVDNLNAALLDSPLIIQDTTYAEIELLNDDSDGASIGYRNSSGLIEIAQVIAGVVGDVCVTIDPTPSDTVELSSVDPIDIRTDQDLSLTAGTTATLTAAGDLTLSGASDVIQTAAGDMTLTATGLLKLGAALGEAVQLAGFTMPTADGAAGTALQTNGSGVLSFGSVASSKNVITAWAVFQPDGTLIDSYNVTSIAKITTGAWTITFTAALDNANYAVAGSTYSSISAGVTLGNAVPSTTSVQVYTKNSANAAVDPQFIHVIVVGGKT